MVVAHYGQGSTAAEPRFGSSGQAPDAVPGEAIVQVYAARAARWRGAFGVHTWMAVKPSHATGWTRLEVIGYRVHYGDGAVRVRSGTPDGIWFGNRPTLLRDLRGIGPAGAARVDAIIERLLEASDRYPYDDEYHVWPGPNSNTYIAWLASRVPELRLELPPHAIGKDYLPGGALLAITPSGTGAQLSLGGYAGLMIGLEEGVEINVAGLSAGVDLWPPAIKLPGVGRLGFPDTRRYVLRD